MAHNAEDDEDNDDHVVDDEGDDHDVAEDEVEDGDFADGDVKGEEDDDVNGPKAGKYCMYEPAQSKCMSTCHKRPQKIQLPRKCAVKMPRPRWGQERARTICASLPS